METEPKNPRTDTVDDGRDFLAHISATDKLLSEIPGVDWTWRGREKHPESQLNEGKKDEQLHNMMLFDACETERSAWWTLSVRHGLDKRRRDDIFTRAFETFCFRFSISRAASECRLEVTVVGRGASLSCMLEAMKQSTCDPQEKHTHTQNLETQRCSRRARKARSFSRKVARHKIFIDLKRTISVDNYGWHILSCLTDTRGQCWKSLA